MGMDKKLPIGEKASGGEKRFPGRTAKADRKKRGLQRLKNQLPLHFMLIPGILTLIVFHLVPLIGLRIAFQKFVPVKGFLGDQKWVGWGNFRLFFSMPNFVNIFRNTVVIALGKIIFGMVVAVVVSLLLNEIRAMKFRKTVQTIIYAPYFLSWVVFGGILVTILSPSEGIINQMIRALGFEPVFFLGNARVFPATLIATDTWKNFGMSTIVYLATLTGIDPGLYEAASIDGANRWKQVIHISLPAMAPIIMLTGILNIGSILNAGFDQVLVLYNSQVMSTGDIIDTFVYRMGLKEMQYGLSTAVGLFKSVLSTILMTTAYYLSYKFSDYRVW